MVLAAGLSLSGCGALNTGLSSMIADNWPTWAGGLPKDAPPRPGDPAYEAYEREQEAKTLMGARPTPAAATQPAPQASPAVARQAPQTAQGPARGDGEDAEIKPQGRGIY